MPHAWAGLSGGDNRRLLGPAGTGISHQCSGDAGSVVCSESILETPSEQDSIDTVGQHISGSPHQQDGRHQIPGLNRPDQSDLVMVPGKGPQAISTTHTRQSEYHCRLLVKVPEGQDRLGLEPQDLHSPESTLGPYQVDLFATRFSTQVPRFLGQTQRPRQWMPSLRAAMLCTPTLVSNHEYLTEGQKGKSDNNSHHPTLEDTTVVSSDHGYGDRSPNSPTRVTRHSNTLP